MPLRQGLKFVFSGYNRDMRRGLSTLLLILMAAAAAFPGDQTQATPVLPCGEEASCTPSRHQLKEAKADFDRGLKLQRGKHFDGAFQSFDQAAKLAPGNVDYLTARELVRQQLVYDTLQRGNAALLQGRKMEALADFRKALDLDPKNAFAQERLQDAMSDWAPKPRRKVDLVAQSPEVWVDPSTVRADFHYTGNSRDLLQQVAAVYGIKVILDDSVASRSVRFDITNVGFFTAMEAANAVTHTFWAPVSAKEILLAGEGLETRRTMEPMALRTFYVHGVTTAADLTSVVNVLRGVFEIKFITPQPQSNTITIRAPQSVLDAATRFLESLDDSRPQVMLDVKVFEISSTLTRAMGLNIPNQFRLFNIPAAALVALGGQNIQDLINQLIASGGINQANSTALSALLAQLQNQQNSIFSQPVATFGNGLTLTGLSLGTAGFQASLNESSVKDLEHATFRVAQGDDATFRIGSRYPILNSTFAPIFNSSAISQVIQNNSFEAPFPSFNYEDLGLSLKAKPTINRGGSVGLHLEMQLRTLLGQSINGVPIISNREYTGSINLLDGEPAVVAGEVSQTETRSMGGIPGLGAVPGLNQVMVTNNKELDQDELLMVITPHVVTRPEGKNTLVWLH